MIMELYHHNYSRVLSNNNDNNIQKKHILFANLVSIAIIKDFTAPSSLTNVTSSVVRYLLLGALQQYMTVNHLRQRL